MSLKDEWKDIETNNDNEIIISVFKLVYEICNQFLKINSFKIEMHKDCDLNDLILGVIGTVLEAFEKDNYFFKKTSVGFRLIGKGALQAIRNDDMTNVKYASNFDETIH